MSIEAYVTGAKWCGLSVGDYVRLTRRARDYEGGWGNVWPSDADAWVGDTLRVAGIADGNGGVKCVRFAGQSDEDWFMFPYFILEKVDSIKVRKGAASGKCQIFNPGDIVRVTRVAQDDENGWCNGWVPAMNAWVGKKCRVVADAGSSGVRCENLGGTDWWSFPAFVLEKVSDAETPPEEKKMFDIGDHVRIIGTWLPREATGRVEAKIAPDVWAVRFDTHKEGDPEWGYYPAEALERIEDEPAPEFIPFETRVLVRDSDDFLWIPAVYGFRDEHRMAFSFITVGGMRWRQCIPYEGNEHLLGTSKNPKADN